MQLTLQFDSYPKFRKTKARDKFKLILMVMEKTSVQAGNCSQQSLQQGKRHVVQKQASVQSAVERRHQRKALQEYQLSLEKDISKLQKQLKQEVDTHKALERAFTRTLGALPRFSPGLASKVQELVAEVAVLEEEVVHLEECIALLHQGLQYNEALHTSDSERMQKDENQNSLLLSKEEGSRIVQSNHLQAAPKEKRNSIIAKLLPPAIDKLTESPSLLSAYGEPKQKLSRSVSYIRSASFQKTSTFCFG